MRATSVACNASLFSLTFANFKSASAAFAAFTAFSMLAFTVASRSPRTYATAAPAPAPATTATQPVLSRPTEIPATHPTTTQIFRTAATRGPPVCDDDS